VGLGEVHRARAGDRVAAAGFKAAGAVQHGAHELDNKLKISEHAGKAVDAVRESTVAKKTGEVFVRASSGVKSATAKVMESEKVAQATAAVSAGFKSIGAGISTLAGKVTMRRQGSKGSMGSADGEMPTSAPASVVTAAPVPVAAPTGTMPAFTLDDSTKSP
jgi:hypothetical protein